MAYSNIAASLYAVGKAITANLFSLIDGNLEDHESRLLTVEASANKIVFWDGTVLGAAEFSTASGVSFHRVQAAIDLTDIKIAAFTLGAASGTLEIDIQKSSSLDFTSSASVFTTKPSLDYSAISAYDESTNAVLDAGQLSLVEGDYLRLDVTSKPSDIGKFFFYAIGEAT